MTSNYKNHSCVFPVLIWHVFPGAPLEHGGTAALKQSKKDFIKTPRRSRQRSLALH